jgi:hypothetical protein
MNSCARKFLSLIFALALAGSAWAQSGITIQGGHSGGCYNAAQSGHGVFAEVLDDPSVPTGKRMVVAWYAFFQGTQVWILAVGDVVQEGTGQVAVMDAWIYDGNAFPPAYNPDLLDEIPWGEIRMYFIGCDNAVLQWDSDISGYGSGSISMQRLTTISGTSCDPGPGEPPADDHGDTWQTATAFPVKAEYNDAIEGRHENRDDVDVFVFTLTGSQPVAIFTLGSTDTIGTLYRINNNQETEIAEDDDSGISNNFLIEANLTAGTYSIHVKPNFTGIYGGYTLYLQTDTD